MKFHTDGTLDCACGLPLFPIAYAGEGVRCECANRHVQVVPLPADREVRRLIRKWIASSAHQQEMIRERRDSRDVTEP